MSFETMMDEIEKENETDAERYRESDEGLCMLCHAYGNDKRSLFVACFYRIKEIVPEFISLSLVENMERRGYYLRICKTCRGRFLGHLREWAAECKSRRDIPKDHDGDDLWDRDPIQNIPVRIDGMTVMLSELEYKIYKEREKK